MSIEQAQAILDDHPFLHQDRFGKPKDGGLNRKMGERFIAEIVAVVLEKRAARDACFVACVE